MSRKRQFWLVEIWLENREIFKAVALDAILFLVLLGVLALANAVIDRIELRPDRKELIETIHFCFVVSIMVLMGITMVFEVGIARLARARSNHAASPGEGYD